MMDCDRSYVPMQTTIAEVQEALQTARIVLLHGGPGSGKTSLARYIAWHESRKQTSSVNSASVQTTCFPNGEQIFLHCGNGAHVVIKQQELLRKLKIVSPTQDGMLLDNIEFRQKFHAFLQKKLSKHRALVVLDDVWDDNILQNLLVPAEQVKYLVTTQVPHLWTGSDLKKVKLQGVGLDNAQQILGNYAGFPSGLIPENLKDLTKDIINGAESHPLALETLGLIVSSGDIASSVEWQYLKDDQDNYVQREVKDLPIVPLAAKYPPSVYASTMIMFDTLDDDAKNLLYGLVLFKGPFIQEDLVRLLLMYSQPKGSIMEIDPCKRNMEVRGLVKVKQELMWPTFPEQPYVDLYRRVVWIHPLHHEFILNSRTEDIQKITNFLDDNVEFLHRGKRSNSDLATVLCALYGEQTIKQRAVKKMGSYFIWTNECVDWLAMGLRVMVSFMLSEGHRKSPNPDIARAATEVFWKLYIYGELDDHNIAVLLSKPECTVLTCGVLRMSSGLLYRVSRELYTEFIPRAWCPTRPVRCLIQPVQVPFCLETLLTLLADVDKHMQGATLLALSALSRFANLPQALGTEFCDNLLAIPGLLGKLVQFLSKDLDGMCLPALGVIGNVARFRKAVALIKLVPDFVERLARLVAQDVDENIEKLAVTAIADLLGSGAVYVRKILVATPSVLERVVELLSKEFEARCREASRVIQMLSRSQPELQVLVTQVPSCLEKLAGLLAQDVERKIQERALDVIGNIFCGSDAEQIGVDMSAIPGLLDRLVSFLSRNFENRCVGATRVIRSLVISAPQISVLFCEFPSCLEKLVALLAQHVEEKIQVQALSTLVALSQGEGIPIRMFTIPNLLDRLVELLSKRGTCYWAAKCIGQFARNPSDRVAMSQFPLAIDSLLVLIGDKVAQETQWVALTALFNLEYLPQTSLADFPHLLGTIVGQISADYYLIKRQWSAAMIESFAASPGNRVLIREFPYAVERLVRLLVIDEDNNSIASALGTLTYLAMDPEAMDPESSFAATMPLLLDRLAVLLFDDVLLFPAVKLVSLLSRMPSNIDPIMLCSVLRERLVGLLTEDVDETIRDEALSTLLHLSWEQHVPIKLLTIPGLLYGLASSSSTKFFEKRGSYGAAVLLWRLSASTPSNQITIARATAQYPLAIGALVAMLREDRTAMVALEALIRLDCMHRITLVDNLNLLRTIVEHLSSDNFRRRHRSAEIIARTSPGNTVLIAEFPHALERLVGMLAADEHDEGKATAAEALIFLAMNPNTALAITAIPQLLERLVPLTLHDDNALQCLAAWLTLSLAVQPSDIMQPLRDLSRRTKIGKRFRHMLSPNPREFSKRLSKIILLKAKELYRNLYCMVEFSELSESSSGKKISICLNEELYRNLHCTNEIRESTEGSTGKNISICPKGKRKLAG